MFRCDFSFDSRDFASDRFFEITGHGPECSHIRRCLRQWGDVFSHQRDHAAFVEFCVCLLGARQDEGHPLHGISTEGLAVRVRQIQSFLAPCYDPGDEAACGVLFAPNAALRRVLHRLFYSKTCGFLLTVGQKYPLSALRLTETGSRFMYPFNGVALMKADVGEEKICFDWIISDYDTFTGKSIDAGLLQRLRYLLVRIRADGTEEDIALEPIEKVSDVPGPVVHVKIYPKQGRLAEGVYRLIIGPQTQSELFEAHRFFFGDQGDMTSLWKFVRN